MESLLPRVFSYNISEFNSLLCIPLQCFFWTPTFKSPLGHDAQWVTLVQSLLSISLTQQCSWSYAQGSANSCLPTLPFLSPFLHSYECAKGKAEMFEIASPLSSCTLKNGCEGAQVGGKTSRRAFSAEGLMEANVTVGTYCI